MLIGCTESQDQIKQDVATRAPDAEAREEGSPPASRGETGDLAIISGPDGEARIGDTLQDFKSAFPMPVGANFLPGDGYSQFDLDEWGWELEDRQYVSVGYEGDKVWFVEWWRNDLTHAGIEEVIEEELQENGTSTFVTQRAAGTGCIWSSEEVSRLLFAWTDNPYGCTIIVGRISDFAVLNFRPDYLTEMVRLMELLDAPPAGVFATDGR